MKYEFTDETKTVGGIELRRIRATKDIARYGVKTGDLGGWIEDERNLEQYGDARVSGNARVSGDAWDKSPLYIQGTVYALYMATKSKVGCGCQVFTFAGWERHWREIAEKYNMTEEQQQEYVTYFNLACERYGKTECKIDIADESGNEPLGVDE